MADNKKGRKVGRSKRNGQASRYQNERRCEHNKLVTLKRHVKHHGMTGKDVLDAMRKCEIILFGVPKTDTAVQAPKPQSEAAKTFYRSADCDKRRREMRDASLGIRKAA